MCGICGWVGLKSSDAIRGVESMLQALAHRGPDASGVWQGNGHGSVLGHTRLSIIDLAGSAQPLTNEDGTVVVTYNGEIYNYRELRKRLAQRGHHLRTDGDTEVLVHLYEEFGREMVDHLDGMFAFGLFDVRQRSLLLARDRIGIKPLYYWHDRTSGDLVFASDLGAILANAAVPRRLHRRALAQYLQFGFAVHPDSWLEDVYQVEPGQTVEWKAGALDCRKYYTWQYAPAQELAGSGAAIARLKEELSAAVESHLVADVPLGSFLSGGLDSSVVTATAQQVRRGSGDDIESFTVRFWIPEYDESPRARAIARELGTQHTEIDAKELGFTRSFLDLYIQRLGEPFGDTSALAVYLLCHHARPYVKVALGGEGGDELFYGYTGWLKQRLARRLRVAPSMLRRVGVRMTNPRGPALTRRANKALRLSLLADAELIMEADRRWSVGELDALLGADVLDELYPPGNGLFPELQQLIGEGENGGFLEQQLRFHMLAVLPCDSLFKVDRMSMAHGLEVRVPLLSNRMLEYGRHLPLDQWIDPKRTKEPLRTLAERMVPTLAEPSPKRGFSVPLDSWMREVVVPCWREWDLTATLSAVGYRPKPLNELVATYERLQHVGEGYHTRTLSSKLFDLLGLGLWLQNYRVTV